MFGCYVLDSRPASEFRYETAKNKLVALDFDADEATSILFTTPGDKLGCSAMEGQLDQGGIGRHGKLMRLAGWVDIESRISVRPICVNKLPNLKCSLTINPGWLCGSCTELSLSKKSCGLLT